MPRFRPGFPKTFLNNFRHAAWAALIRLSMSFLADIFDVSTLPRHGNYSFSRTSQLIFSRQGLISQSWLYLDIVFFFLFFFYVDDESVAHVRTGVVVC